VSDFARKVVRWQRLHGRHDLPWQRSRDPYRIWLSEVMLQQTRVETVLPYFERFLGRFPGCRRARACSARRSPAALERTGLLLRAPATCTRPARQIVRLHAGRFPANREKLDSIAGHRPLDSGARSRRSRSDGRAAILDGNVKRVLARCVGVEGRPSNGFWPRSFFPARGIQGYTQGLMDLGATVCQRAKPSVRALPGRRRLRRAAGESCSRVARSAQGASRFQLRNCAWLVLRYERRVLLERRPPTGLWGGLWTFPECFRRREVP
jgi:A/G-specific adenine glycosylase